MKKIISLTVIFAFSIQFYAQQNNLIGINFGGNLSKFRGNWLIESYDPAFGFLAGISFEKSIKNNLSFKTNLNFVRKNYKTTATITDYNGNQLPDLKLTEQFDYMELPILIKYQFNNSKFFVNGGGFLSYLLAMNEKTNYGNSSLDTNTMKKIDAGLSAGLGYGIILSEDSIINIELRDNLGLINIAKGEVKDNGTDKTNSLSLILNWNFKFL